MGAILEDFWTPQDTPDICTAVPQWDPAAGTSKSSVAMNRTGEQDRGFEGLGILNGTLSSQKVLGYILDASALFLLVVIMMSLGCTLQLSGLKKYILNPKEVGIAVVAQYGIMPLSAFSLGHVFHLNAIESIAILICGCCPGGNISNILTLAIGGDVNLSIVMTVCSSILALGMMPFLLYIYGLGMDLGEMHNNIPYEKIIISLLITVLPCCAGMLLNSKRPQYTQCFMKFGRIVGLLTAIALLILSALYVKSDILKIFSPWLIGSAVLMPLIGYVLGYGMAFLFRLSYLSRRAICMETGCQNVQLCSAILKVTFEADVIGPYFMFPLLYVIFQLLIGLLFILIFRIYDRIKASGKHIFLIYITYDLNIIYYSLLVL
ncbi:hepatic sodium/bile acid cotransporter [Aquarana catesbeiana]|uniref:hepatic sodium/bile acid cotransporter n=1 Tax=Aquarana catesbeiana TaxID=8400 RepID=UPI003CC9B859